MVDPFLHVGSLLLLCLGSEEEETLSICRAQSENHCTCSHLGQVGPLSLQVCVIQCLDLLCAWLRRAGAIFSLVLVQHASDQHRQYLLVDSSYVRNCYVSSFSVELRGEDSLFSKELIFFIIRTWTNELIVINSWFRTKQNKVLVIVYSDFLAWLVFSVIIIYRTLWPSVSLSQMHRPD